MDVLVLGAGGTLGTLVRAQLAARGHVAIAQRRGQPLARAGVTLRDCAYVDAHEQVAAAMHDVDGAVVRATGFFSAFASLVPMVRAGVPADVGSGRARTNPICERDLAEIVVDIALGGEGPRDVAAGGPEVLTRAEIYDLVAEAAGRRTT